MEGGFYVDLSTYMLTLKKSGYNFLKKQETFACQFILDIYSFGSIIITMC